MDEKNQEPIVLGTVKKGRTGKPFLAIIIIILIGLLIYFLPIIQGYFKDQSIIDLITSGELINFIKNKSQESNNETNKDDPFVKLGSGFTLINNNVIISNIDIKDNVLSYSIGSKMATYDATKDNLYLQIYVNKDELVFTKSLDEIYSITLKEVKENVSFYNETNEYYAILKNISNDEIEDIILSSDESGLASIVCKLNNDSYEYIFQNKELIEIKRVFQYSYDDKNIEEYQKLYKTYNDLAINREKYSIETNITEDYLGFNYQERLDLSLVDVTELGANYYPYKSMAKVIKFKQVAKGFDCE